MLVSILIDAKEYEPYAQKIARYLEPFDVEVEMYVASAHKVPELVLDLVNEVNNNDRPTVWITIASGSNALSGMVASNSLHPVIACPYFENESDYSINIHSSIQMPPNTPSMVAIEPQNTAMAAVKILALTDKKLIKLVERHIQEMKESF